MKTERLFIRWPRIHHFSLIIGALLALGMLSAAWYKSAKAPYIDQDFSYTVDTQIATSLYDAQTGDYTGQYYSYGTHNLQAVSYATDTARIQDTLRTTRLDTNKTQTTTNYYAVKPASGKVTSQENHDPGASLFAPRRIVKGKSFSYWYEPQKRSVTMRFSGTERLFGLTVYSYVSQGQSVVDPASGLVRKTDLRIWIEPTTGWLINAQDNTITYGHTTNDKLVQVSRSATVFNEVSIKQHVEYAKQLKRQLDFGLQVAPSIIFVCILSAILVFVIRMSKIRSVPIRGIVAAILVVCLANTAGWLWNIEPLLEWEPGGVVLSPLTSICFMAVAADILLLCKRQHTRIVLWSGVAIGLIALVTALGNSNILSLHIDDAILGSRMDMIDGVRYGRMSLFGSLALMILAIGVIKAAMGGAARLAAQWMAGMAITLGIAGLIARLFLLEEVFVMPSIATLSISGSLLCLLCGGSLLQVLLRREPAETRRSFFGALAKPALVTIPIIIIGVVAQLQQNFIAEQLQTTFKQQTMSIRGIIEKNVGIYTNTLIGAKALFAASQSVEREEWHNYISALDVPKEYPGMQTIGFAPLSTLDGAKTPRVPILYIEPADDFRQSLKGYDLAANKVINETLRQATKTGKPTISGMVNLPQNSNSALGNSGFVMVLPVYVNGSDKLTGFVFATFDKRLFFAHSLKNEASTISVSVHDGFATNSSSLLYGGATDVTNDNLTQVETMYADGHPWTLSFTADDTFNVTEAKTPGAIFLTGGILYLGGLAGFLWITSTPKKRDDDSKTKTRISQIMGR